jgi:hypothetical protein
VDDDGPSSIDVSIDSTDNGGAGSASTVIATTVGSMTTMSSVTAGVSRDREGLLMLAVLLRREEEEAGLSSARGCDWESLETTGESGGSEGSEDEGDAGDAAELGFLRDVSDATVAVAVAVVEVLRSAASALLVALSTVNSIELDIWSAALVAITAVASASAA